MKKILKIILLIFIVFLGYEIYNNYDYIVDFIKDIYDEKKDIVIKESNAYNRNYNYISFTNSNDFILKNKNQIQNVYYNILNNGWDNFIIYCGDEYKECIEDIKTISESDKILSNINNYVSPFNGFKEINTIVSSNGQININVIKNYDNDEIKNINDEIDKIISKLSLDKYNDKEKIIKIHEYIIQNTSYDREKADNGTSKYNSSKASGVLFEHYGVCAGYSDLFALFLDKFNIPNLKISSENHVWNLVFIDNQWKHIDVTWDDDDQNKKVLNTFLLIDTKNILKRDKEIHDFDTSFFKEAN